MDRPTLRNAHKFHVCFANIENLHKNSTVTVALHFLTKGFLLCYLPHCKNTYIIQTGSCVTYKSFYVPPNGKWIEFLALNLFCMPHSHSHTHTHTCDQYKYIFAPSSNWRYTIWLTNISCTLLNPKIGNCMMELVQTPITTTHITFRLARHS